MFEWLKNALSVFTKGNTELFISDEFSSMYELMKIWDAYYRNDLSSMIISGGTPEVYKKSLVTYPCAYRVCDKVAKLVLTELPRFTFDDKSAARMAYIIKKNRLFELLRDAQTEMCALGNIYLKLNTCSKRDYPIIELVRGIDAVPAEVIWGEITGATFYSLKRIDANACYWLAQTYIEEGGKHVIKNRLFKGTTTELGRQVGLNSIEETAEYEEIEDLKTERPWFFHCKSPQPNNKKPTSPLGISIFANSLEMIDHLNLTMNSYYKDDRIKQPKAVVTEDLVKYKKDGDKMKHEVDFEREFYIHLKSTSGDQLFKIIDMPSKQRDFEESIQGKLDRFYESCGLFRSSVQKQGGAKTATEWELADKDSIDTGDDYKNNWLITLDNLFRSVMEIDNTYYQGAGVTERTFHDVDQEITIQFMDGLKNDMTERAERARGLYKDNMLSLETALGQVFPSWTEARIKEEVERLNIEKANTAKVTEIDFMNQNPDLGGSSE